MSLITEYQSRVTNKLITYDTLQFDIITKLENLKVQIEKRSANILKIFHSVPSGIYLYSDVGRGKTMLMDLFFNNLNLRSEFKLRMHFHIFMRSIHENLQLVSGQSDPVDYIIKHKFKKNKVICLDEFIVTDIADAMLLARIIKSLIKYKIILITTSNTAPDNLYKNGLQRSLFLPAIELLKSNLNIIYLNGLIDYRAQMLEQMSCYYWPEDQNNINNLHNIFIKLNNNIDNNQNLIADRNTIKILQRPIQYIKSALNLIWFDFNIICNTARSQSDYIEIATIYQSILISGVYQLNDYNLDIVRRFINLIDILYDYKVKLIICAQINLENLYIGQSLALEFNRVISRIKEMQTTRYLESAHMS